MTTIVIALLVAAGALVAYAHATYLISCVRENEPMMAALDLLIAPGSGPIVGLWAMATAGYKLAQRKRTRAS